VICDEGTQTALEQEQDIFFTFNLKANLALKVPGLKNETK